MSTLEVNKITPSTGTTVTLGDSGDSIDITSGATVTNFKSTGIDDNATSTEITIESGGDIGIGTTNPDGSDFGSGTGILHLKDMGSNNTGIKIEDGTTKYVAIVNGGGDAYTGTWSNNNYRFYTNSTERMRIDNSGNLLVGTTSNNKNLAGASLNADGDGYFTRNDTLLYLNRLGSDGELLRFSQAGNLEGNIEVSGTTVSYNGFTGTHWSRLADNSKPTILRGTIMESLDEMCDWYQAVADVAESTDEEGNVIPAHQVKKSIALGSKNVGDSITFTHNGVEHTGTVVKEGDVKHSKCKVSDTSESKAVYGVFQAWDNDDDTVNDMYVAQTGTFVVRLNSSVTTLNKGDLIQSNGDGTGKVQSDDIIRASTVAKVLSTTKIETYEDGSYIVPCSLHC